MRRKSIIAIGILFISLGWVLATGTAGEKKPIKLGVVFIMSGQMGGYGKHGTQAIQLALDEINGQGGILERKVEAIFQDDELKAEKGVQITKKFIAEDQVDFIIGPTSSGVALAMADIVEKEKKILVLTQAATNSLTDAKFNRYLFSTLSNAMMHSRAGASLMASKPYKRWMCIGPGYSYGYESWNSFKDKLRQLRPDVEIVGELWPKLTEPDYTSFIQKIVEAKPDAVWSPLWGMDAVNFIKQALPLGLFDKIKFAFPDGAALETLLPLGKSMPDGLFVASRHFFLTPDSSMNRGFVKTYQERFKEYPDYMAEETYAGVYFLKAAIERAGSTDTEKVIAAVEKEPLAWETPEGWKIMRKEDHQVVEDVVWGETSYSETYGFAILKNMQSIQAEEICRTPAELKEVRMNYEKRLKEPKK
ncbi:MAG TPA: ABC transporter substrate-binding protein [Thermodesulfobacteriota bacterium]|nr:ABC transporter substrate-binding protein [Thermodesulfobacteriota bacterium]